MTTPRTGAEELGDPELERRPARRARRRHHHHPHLQRVGKRRELLHRLTESVPSRLPCEVVFVDDSTDDTPEVIRERRAGLPVPGRRAAPRDAGRRPRRRGRRGHRRPRAPTGSSSWTPTSSIRPRWCRSWSAAGERSGADLVVASRYITRRQPRGPRRRLPHRRLARRDLADEGALPAPAARHQRPDERLLRDPPQRGDRRGAEAARLQDPAGAGGALPSARRSPRCRSSSRSGSRASPSRRRRKGCASSRTSPRCVRPSPAARMVGLRPDRARPAFCRTCSGCIC